MNALTEARYRDDEIDPIFADADNPDATLDQLTGMVKNMFGVGYERKQQLDELTKATGRESTPIHHRSDGSYFIEYAHVGQYADFGDRSNHAYLKEKYPWLHDVGEGLGFDEDKGAESHKTFEDFLGSIPHEDWNSFLEDMENLADSPVFDEDAATELEMKETNRWMTEDGGPDLIKGMVKHCDDAYEAYLLSKVTPNMIWEWSRETEHYPESQGQGDVWMDMDKFAKERETQEWFLEHLDDDLAGWEQIKKAQFDDLAGDLLDRTLREMAQEDERVAYVSNNLDGSRLWAIFLKTFPDEPAHEGDPHWYFWKPQYNQPGTWRAGFQLDTHNMEDWKQGLANAMAYLKEQPWFWQMIGSWQRRGPEDHPEFKFEAQQPLETEPDPDDPEIFVKHGGGVQEEVVYEDDKIVVMYPRDYHTVNYHLRLAGLPEINKQNYQDLFKYKDVFIVQGKQPVDLLGREEKRELAVIWGDSDIDLRVWTGSIKSPSLHDVLANPEYGRSIRKMLLRFYRERMESDPKAANVLLQIGGARELRRGDRRGHINLKEHGIPLGLYYISKHKYGLAAKAFGRSPKTISPTGVVLIYDAVEDLVSVFNNDKAASDVFSHDNYDWFDNMGEPEVKEVVPFLDQKAIDHIRSVMVNRRVWFPDAGPDQRGEWVVLTKKVLSEYDDATILSWLSDPAEEDEGIWDDIIEAIKYAGSDILQAASQDNVYTAYVKAAVDGIEGKSHKWGTHPTKRYKTGEKMESFEVFVPWTSILQFAEKYKDEHGSSYDGDLETLVVYVNADTADVDPNDHMADWSDVNKERAADALHRIFELEAPDAIPGSPEYTDPNQLALPMESLDVDDPEHNAHALSGIPVSVEREVQRQIDEYAHVQGIQIKDVQFDFQQKEHKAYEFRVRFRPEGAMLGLIGDMRCFLWEFLMRVRLTPAVYYGFGPEFIINPPVLEDCRASHPGCVCCLFPLWLKLPEEEVPF